MGSPLTYQDDLDLWWVPEIDDIENPTVAEITEGHRFAEVMADGFDVNNTQNVVSEELLRGGQTASTIGSEQYEPQIMVRVLDADNDDLDSLTRGERGYLVAILDGGGEEPEGGERCDVWEVRSAGPALDNPQANAYTKRTISLPAERWAIDVEVNGG